MSLLRVLLSSCFGQQRHGGAATASASCLGLNRCARRPLLRSAVGRTAGSASADASSSFGTPKRAANLPNLPAPCPPPGSSARPCGALLCALGLFWLSYGINRAVGLGLGLGLGMRMLSEKQGKQGQQQQQHQQQQEQPQQG